MATAERPGDDLLMRSIDENLAAFGRFMARETSAIRPAIRQVIPPAATLFPVGADGHGIWTRAQADAELDALLPGAGFTLVVDLPVMVLAERPAAAPPLPPGTEIRAVVDAAGAADFRSADLEGFAGSDHERAAVEALFGDPRSLLAPEIGAFVAYVDGVAAAAALSFTDVEVSRIAWVGTVPRFRRRGLGGAVTLAAARAGFDRGARCAVLEASEMAESVYRGLGFREITRYRVWLAG